MLDGNNFAFILKHSSSHFFLSFNIFQEIGVISRACDGVSAIPDKVRLLDELVYIISHLLRYLHQTNTKSPIHGPLANLIGPWFPTMVNVSRISNFVIIQFSITSDFEEKKRYECSHRSLAIFKQIIKYSIHKLFLSEKRWQMCILKLCKFVFQLWLRFPVIIAFPASYS